MKLSEAMRLGSLTTKQAFGKTHPYNEEETCAMAAAITAEKCEIVARPEWLGGHTPRPGDAGGTIQAIMPKAWQPIFILNPACPACGTVQTMVRTITHLNDDHRWTREDIADWVEQFESEPPAVNIKKEEPDQCQQLSTL